MSKKVALIRGDGVGPELASAMLKVFSAVGTNVEVIPCEAGSEWWEVHAGESFFPTETWEILEEADACYKAPTTTPLRRGTPKSVAVSIRQEFDLYANIRPVQTFQNLVGKLGEVDFICVREGTEGLYSGIEYRLNDEVAIAIRKITRRSSGRVARKAFELAKEKGWSKVVVIYKINVLKETDGMFYETVQEVANGYPDIELEPYIIDNFAQQLVKNPQRFNQNVILGTNLFMDILSEEAAGLVGSVGLIYSGNFGDDYAMFEPAHGSAPKYKGLDKVNPTATILSGAWMLEYVGDKESSMAIFQATRDVIAEGKYLTYDLEGDATTSQMADAIAEKAKRSVKR